MARLVANVDVITDSFEIWLLETNELLHALSTEIITANATYANTGNSTFQRTAQLYGTFGANNLVVSDWMKGGNVNGSFANLMISTNTVLSNVNATVIRLEVANGSSNSFLWQYGLHAGLTGANLVANTTKLTVQSNSTTNTTATAFSVVAANSTNTATMNPISFSTGLFVANTIQISLGANVTANATNGGTVQVTGSAAVGNTTSNSSGLYVGNTVTNSQVTSVRFFAAEGSNTVLANNQMISIANTTSSANIDPISFRTGLFVANTIQISLGANVAANATNGGTIQVTGSSVVGNTVSNSSGTFVGNTLNASQLTSVRFLTQEGSNTTLANTRIISIANSTATANIEPNAFKTGIFTANTIQITLGANVTANATNGGTVQVTGSATVGNTVANSSGVYVSNSLNSVEHTSFRFLAAEGSNTTLANTRIISIANSIATANIEPNAFKTGIFTGNTIQVSIGANVFANATSLFVGNATFTAVVGNGSINGIANLTITPTSHLIVSGAMNVTSNANFANTIAVTGSATLSNTIAVTGAATLANTLSLTGSALFSNTLNLVGAANLQSTANVAGTLGVVGATSLSNTLSVTGATTLSNTLNVVGAANLQSTANIAGTLGVVGAAALSNTLTVIGITALSNTLNVVGAANLQSSANVAGTFRAVGATTFANTLNVTGATTLANTLAITGTVTLSNTLGVSGSTTLSSTLEVTGNSTFSNIATFKTEHVLDVFANGNLGVSTGSDLLIFEFPKADYSSAKLLIQLKNQGNTQISEVLLAHDTSDAFLTTYGTVSSPASANAGVSLLGTFSANTATANVRVYAKQTRANTASKVVAQFIK